MSMGIVGMLIGTAMVGPVSPIAHQTQVEHRTGVVDTRYNADVRIEHRQVGSVGPGGRPSTLRCMWRAALVVDRQAVHPSGSTMARSFVHDDVAEGSRPGWCSTQRAGIAREVASRGEEMRGHLIRVAQEDHPVLHAEIDRLHGAAQAG